MSEFKDVQTKSKRKKHVTISFSGIYSEVYELSAGGVAGLQDALESVQQAVDAADQLVPLAGQRLVALDVGLLLHLARHQPLRLLAGAVHQLLHLDVQLLHLPHLRPRQVI